MNSNHDDTSMFALLIADVDWLKKVNDTFGHELGHEVLIEIAEMLEDIFGKGYVARFGGEEFVAGIWVKGRKELEEKLEQLFKNIKNHKFTEREIDISISLGGGYTECEKVDGWLMSGMLRLADCNLYYVKEHDRNDYKIGLFDSTKQYEKN